MHRNGLQNILHSLWLAYFELACLSATKDIVNRRLQKTNHLNVPLSPFPHDGQRNEQPMTNVLHWKSNISSTPSSLLSMQRYKNLSRKNPETYDDHKKELVAKARKHARTHRASCERGSWYLELELSLFRVQASSQSNKSQVFFGSSSLRPLADLPV